VRTLLGDANPTMAAMIGLGIVGFGNTDLATLPRSAVDLEAGWIDYARTKTGIDRRVPLCPEQVQAVRAVYALKRKPAAGCEGLVFVTPAGNPYIVGTKDQIGMAFNRLCARCKLARPGRSFYSLRRTFRTWADELGDQRAAALLMGHTVNDIGGVYVQRISDERLKAITESIRARVWPPRAGRARGAASASGRGAKKPAAPKAGRSPGGTPRPAPGRSGSGRASGRSARA
jgi:hypothetical protein